MIYERRYIQFNDLVFDGFDMISDWDGEVSFKGSSQEYSYGHGSYRPLKRNYLFVTEREVSMTITLNMRKIPCDQRKFYVRFVDEELTKPGKLWCIKNGRLLWATAVVTQISENFSKVRDKLVYNVNFVIPGGIWYKADTRKTFLVPTDVCEMLECKGYRDTEACGCECTKCGDVQNVTDCSCCCDEGMCEEMALCHHLDEMDSWHGCNVPYRAVYDCERAENWSADKYIGQKLCTAEICDDGMITGMIHSDTEIPTEDVTVILSGKMTNPWIEINGNTNIITGEYDGDLIIKPSGDVYYTENRECCEPTLLEPDVWVIPEGQRWGWEVIPGDNSIVIHLNNCCHGASCVWLQYEAIAI